jgi:hypothetical protein
MVDDEKLEYFPFSLLLLLLLLSHGTIQVQLIAMARRTVRANRQVPQTQIQIQIRWFSSLTGWKGCTHTNRNKLLLFLSIAPASKRHPNGTLSTDQQQQ